MSQVWHGPFVDDQVDLLFVIGAGGADEAQHAARVRELERLVRILVTGDWNEDGRLEHGFDFLPPADLHIGVVSTNMGSAGYEVDGCLPYASGEDGRWRAIECAGGSPPYFELEAPDDAAAWVACRSEQPTCGFEQPLEAALKALAPAAPATYTAPDYVPPRFFGGTFGHGDTAHEGFLRRDSLLAVVVLAGADDCSARDPSVYDPSALSAVSEELACALQDDALHPIARFIEELAALRGHRPVVFSVIGGVPEDLVPARGSFPDFDRLTSDDPRVRDPRMQPRASDVDPSRLEPACESVTYGSAAPAVRLLSVARELSMRGDGIGVASICADDYRPALAPILELLNVRLGWGSCLVEPLRLRDHCRLELSPPAGTSCDAIAGSVYVRDDYERVVCAVEQITPTAEERASGELPARPGWLVDDYTMRAEWDCAFRDRSRPWGRLVVLPRPPLDTTAIFHCSLPIGPAEPLGTFCAPGTSPAENPCPWLPGGPECDPYALACAIPCASSDDCRAAELPGYTCDLRPLAELDPARFADDFSPRGFCVSATCE